MKTIQQYSQLPTSTLNFPIPSPHFCPPTYLPPAHHSLPSQPSSSEAHSLWVAWTLSVALVPSVQADTPRSAPCLHCPGWVGDTCAFSCPPSPVSMKAWDLVEEKKAGKGEKMGGGVKEKEKKDWMNQLLPSKYTKHALHSPYYLCHWFLVSKVSKSRRG